jgi:Putative auto-transporter adhesin, head GIN domain
MERRISIFFPLVLISAGLLWILIQMQIIQPSNLWALVYLWPFLLIAAGLGLIFRSYWKYSRLLMDVLVVGGAFTAVLFAPQLGLTHAPVYTFNGSGYFVGLGGRGSGKLVTENRDVHDFRSIRLSFPAQVFINQGETESLTIQAEDNVAPEIGSRVVDGVLEIDNLNGSHFPISPTKPVKITIVVKDLSELDFETAGEVNLIGLKTDQLKLIMDGAGTLTLDNVQLNGLDSTLSGVGSIRASGTTNSEIVRVQGLGSFNDSDLHSQQASVSLDGMGSATVWADKNLNANVDGLGSINYYGDAQVIKTVDGLGSIKDMGDK